MTGADILGFLSHGFIQRALIAGSFIAILCSTLGVFLVLRRLSLIGDGLAHVTFVEAWQSAFCSGSTPSTWQHPW